MDKHTERIQAMNDLFRKYTQGNGQIVITRGIEALGTEHMMAIVRHVQEYDDFSEENDPNGEHDFGAFDYEDQKIFWKIDYYDPSYQAASEDPTSVERTRRVLTIMLASEY